MLKTTNYQITLEDGRYEKTYTFIKSLIEDRVGRIKADRLLEDVKGCVRMEVERYNLHHSDNLTWGMGNNHIWVSKEGGERVMMISYQIIHKMNLQTQK